MNRFKFCFYINDSFLFCLWGLFSVFYYYDCYYSSTTSKQRMLLWCYQFFYWASSWSFVNTFCSFYSTNAPFQLNVFLFHAMTATSSRDTSPFHSKLGCYLLTLNYFVFWMMTLMTTKTSPTLRHSFLSPFWFSAKRFVDV